MKIYAINNYDLEWFFKDHLNIPRHQSWGIEYLRKQGYFIQTKILKPSKILNFFFRKYAVPLQNFLFTLSFIVSLKGFRYDIVISFYSPTLTFFPLFKRLGLIKSKFVTVVHHEGVSIFSLKHMNKVLFLSEEIKKTYPTLYNTATISWLPDLEFYEKTYQKMCINIDKRLSKPILISTGKTFRDDNLLIKVCDELNIPLILFGNPRDISSSMVKYVPASGYLSMLNQMEYCAVNIVACTNETNLNKKFLCGLTSILDGIALGMPLIYSNNCHLPFDPEKEGFGLCYEAESLNGLKEKIDFLTHNICLMKEMGKKARTFAEKNNYTQYCSDLVKQIEC